MPRNECNQPSGWRWDEQVLAVVGAVLLLALGGCSTSVKPERANEKETDQVRTVTIRIDGFKKSQSGAT
jgi:hypothetical protein